jgi:hypothetical protein
MSFLILSCSDSTDPEGEAPDIPPLSTFVMDFESFPDTSGGAAFQKGQQLEIQAKDHWGWAAFNILVWNALLTVTLATPVAAFTRSFQEDPQFSNGKWMWSYSFNAFGIPYSAELHATAVADGINWEMFISKANEYENFNWFSGFSNLLLTEGNWTLNKNPGDPVSFLRIDWNRNPSANTADIKYSNITDKDPESGGYIFYGISNSGDYDRFYDVFNKGLNNLTEIEWLFSTKEGRIKDPNHFQSNEWYCWDPELEDRACP